MTTETETRLARAKIRQWRDIRSGWLVINPDQIVIYRNCLFRGPQQMKSFATSRLALVRQDADNQAAQLVFNGSDGELEDELFSFADEKQAEMVNTVLVGLLKESEERKRQQQEEAARLEKEQQERLRQIREAFASEVWESAEILWFITKADYSMVNAVITVNWDEAKRQYSIIWQQVERLKKIYQIELETVLRELDEVVASQNGQEVIRSAGNLLKQLSDQALQSQIFWNKWQDHKDMLSNVIPNHNHLSYFLLFSAGHFEALLAAQIEDWAGVNSILSLLRPSGIILRSCFGLDFNGLADTVNSAGRQQNADSITEAARRVESAISASFQKRPFRFEMSEPQPEV